MRLDSDRFGVPLFGGPEACIFNALRHKSELGFMDFTLCYIVERQLNLNDSKSLHYTSS